LTEGGGVLVNISIKDKCVIDEFMKSISFTGPYKEAWNNGFKYSRVSIWGAYRWEYKLEENWNITKRKSLTLQPPNLTKIDHIKSFIIGYFDGDGCAQLDKNKRYTWSVCGSEYMINWIRSFIYNNILEENNKCLVFKHSTANCYYFRKSGPDAYKIKNYFLNAETPWRLERKWSIG
jgi:hypothetical protein